MSRNGKVADYEDEYDDGEGDFDGEDDYDDDDGSDDLEDGVSKRTPARAVSGLNEDDKKAHHNFLERRRRDHIKGSFQQLSASIPTLQGERVSRAQVLKTASEYIVTVRKRNSQMQSEIESLRRENASLEKQVAIMEKRARSGAGVNLGGDYGASTSQQSGVSQHLSHAGRNSDAQIKEEPRVSDDYLDDAAAQAQDLFETD